MGVEQHFVEIQAKFFQEDGVWISHIESLDISTCGDSIEKVMAMTQELVGIFLEDCAARGTLEKVLINAGFQRILIPDFIVKIQKERGYIPPITFCHQTPEAVRPRVRA